MEEFNEILERAVVEMDTLLETVEDAMEHSNAHTASFEDILYELREIKSSIEDQIES